MLTEITAQPKDEPEIIRRVLSGEVDAYADIVRSYQGKVLGLCLSFLRNQTQAEDAAQEIFIKAYQSLDRFRGSSSFSTWLYRITANHCKDCLRVQSRHKTQSLDALTEELGDAVDGLLRPPLGPAAVSAENSEKIEQILAQLSPDERMILVLREAEGLNYKEIARTLNLSLDAVKARLRRARKTLEQKTRHFLAKAGV